MIKLIFDRLLRRSKLYSAVLGLATFFLISIFISFANAVAGTVIVGMIISIIHSIFKKEIVIYDQTWRPTLYFAFVLPPVLTFLITLLF